MVITFETTPSVVMPEMNLSLIKRWIEAVAEMHGYECGKLAYRFCNDEEILEANRQFLEHDYYTDIITFDYTRGNRVSGDMLISLDTVKSNAEMIDAPEARELRRVIIHGLLHLCGINDKGPGEREVMERNENDALRLLDEMTNRMS